MGLIHFFRDKSSAAAAPAKPGLFAALDIGASKTVCFIARTEQTLAGLRPRIVGVGYQPTRGMRAGAVQNMGEAAASIRAAVDQAERSAEDAISEIMLCVTSASLTSRRVQAGTDLSKREVRAADVARVLSEARFSAQEAGQTGLHALPLSWRVDGQAGVKDPRGMVGAALGLDLLMVSARSNTLQNLMACVERARLSVSAAAASPYLAGLAALSRDEIELGALVIDMGAHTSSLAVFSHGVMQHVSAVPVGGAHVTSDIARGLSTPVAAAERIKVLYGSALDSPDDDQAMIEAPPVAGSSASTMVQHPRALLNSIIRPRLEETFELLRDQLEQARPDIGQTPRRVVLTGGAAQLPGACELAARILGGQARIGRPESLTGLGDAVSGPGFSACAGLILRHVYGPGEALSGPPRINESAHRRAAPAHGGRGPEAVWHWLRECF